MTDVESAILSALLELEEKVAQMRTATPKPNLLPVFERLDTLTAQLPKNADPELLHFLHKKSYEKARLLLEGRNSENKRGTCR